MFRVIKWTQNGDGAAGVVEWHQSPDIQAAYADCLPEIQTEWHIKMLIAIIAEITFGKPILVSYNVLESAKSERCRYWIQELNDLQEPPVVLVD